MRALIRCENVVCHRGEKRVLQEIDFSVTTGESIALVGSSGCGKSTLLRAIAGLEPIERGAIWIDDHQASSAGRRIDLPPHRRGIAMLFQDLALWPNLTVAENVRLGLSGTRLSRRETRQRVEQVLVKCQIAELACRRPGTISGGQQQRVALARALATRPGFLLLDEPLGGLDLLTKQNMLKMIAQLQSEFGFGLVLVTHDPIEVQELCLSLAVMEQGRIVERGDLSEIVNHAQTPLSRAFAQSWRALRS